MTICKEYAIILEEAVSRKKYSKNFFRKLKKLNNAKEVNILFHKYHHEIFEEIDCLKCANCCSTVGPRITDHDISRISSGLNKKPSETVSAYMKIDEENDYIFQSMPCPFLNTENNFCSIYENRPKACREYPHTDHRKVFKILEITLKNTFVCPAVYLIVKKVREDLKI